MFRGLTIRWEESLPSRTTFDLLQNTKKGGMALETCKIVAAKVVHADKEFIIAALSPQNGRSHFAALCSAFHQATGHNLINESQSSTDKDFAKKNPNLNYYGGGFISLCNVDEVFTMEITGESDTLGQPVFYFLRDLLLADLLLKLG